MRRTANGFCCIAVLLLGLLPASLVAEQQPTEPTTPAFRDPLQELDIEYNTNDWEFERSSLLALDVYDPFEIINRRTYRFNARFDEYIYLPALEGYRTVTPRPVRQGVSNVFNNLADIPHLANSTLQGQGEKAMRTTARLLLNSTLGIVGIFDVAEKMGLPQEKEDFGQTLANYGVPPGPYLVLPLLGPSTLRDTSGLAVDWSIEDRVNYLGSRDTMNQHSWPYGLYALDLRKQNGFRYGALDSPFEYDQVRYLYIKLRELQTRN
ncbi:MlaA family lipoprotein [Halopseudomonas salegens]|uniref:Phospholipid-binding lipoprotein MlaA n=1 Tax=Halopseudomonas salegens TaxID=1434072 RepID=A0A1H2F294_9GAMM|nr:VacJ family lipoprotein [Halopseudomonas salegens]SDU01058.1 phospholipid-binding lipoprotein MlaA [Halopseudomonas salegens]